MEVNRPGIGNLASEGLFVSGYEVRQRVGVADVGRMPRGGNGRGSGGRMEAPWCGRGIGGFCGGGGSGRVLGSRMERGRK